jgi:hypothetical protein
MSGSRPSGAALVVWVAGAVLALWAGAWIATLAIAAPQGQIPRSEPQARVADEAKHSVTRRTIHTDRYYTCMEYLMQRFDRCSRQMGFKAQTPEECRTWQRDLRTRVAALLGLPTMIRCPLDPQVTERIETDGYVRERVLLQTEPGVIMPLYVLIPGDLRPGERRPAVLAPHGHSSAGKLSPAGRRDIYAVDDRIALYNYDYGVQLVREGFVVFCPDARGFGERREGSMQGDDEMRFISGSCQQLAHMALPLGQTVAGMWVWDLMRLIDYVQQRPECDGHRIGCAGLSGGGLQTLYLAALDERVKCAVVSGYFYGAKEALLEMPDNCACNYVPGLWLLADMGDLGALIAPRPLLIETGDHDPLNGKRGVANASDQVSITRGAYRVLGAQQRLAHDIFSGEHRWHGKQAIPWLKRWLGA